MPLHVSLPSLPFPSLSPDPDFWSLLNKLMVSDRIGARPGSTGLAMADGGALMPDDAVSEEATVALTSSLVLQGTRGCTFIVGIMSLLVPPFLGPRRRHLGLLPQLHLQGANSM